MVQYHQKVKVNPFTLFWVKKMKLAISMETALKNARDSTPKMASGGDFGELFLTIYSL